MLRFVLGLAALLGVAAALSGGAAGSNGNAGSGCIAHRPTYVEDVFEPAYTADCSGHDEPELDPISSAEHSAQDISWTFILPTDGTVPVSAVGPTFWFGGTVTDPASLFGQAFLEVQFYPDGIVQNCNPNGAFLLAAAPNKFTVCSPVWSLTATGQKPNFHEPAAFNAMLTTNGSNKHTPLVMNAGDEITIHFHLGPPSDGWHIDVSDNTTHQSGTIVLNSASGPLLPAFDTQTIGNALGWGIVDDTPNSFVWEIGHTSPFSAPKSQFCLPGDPICDSYNYNDWLGFSPLKIESVSLAGQAPSGYAVVSDFGGNAEITDNCGTVGANPFCNYPFYSQGDDGTFRYGADYPDTANDFGGADQFFQTTDCPGNLGPTYCDHQILP